MKVLKSLFPFASSWTTAGGASSGVTPLAGGALSFATPSQKNGFAIPAGNNTIQITRDLALTGTPSSGLVAFINKKAMDNEVMIHFDLTYHPTVRFKNVGQQSLKLPLSPFYQGTIVQIVHVLWNGNTSQWDRVGGNYPLDPQSQGNINSATPILNTTPACPTANLVYQGRFVRMASPTPEAELQPWFSALAQVEEGTRPMNTVGIALSALISHVQVANQNAIASTDFSLDGPFLITSPNFVGQRGYGGTPFPAISILSTTAYDASDTATF